MELQTHIRCLPAGLGGQVLGHVGLCAARLVRIEQPASFIAHQVGGLYFHISLGNRELHALVLADGPSEDDTVFHIFGDAVDEPVAVANAFGGNQRALGVQAIQDVFEALTFLPDQVLRRYFQVLEEELVGLVVHHVGNRAHRHACLLRKPQIDHEDRHAFRFFLHIGKRRGPCQQDHPV